MKHAFPAGRLLLILFLVCTVVALAIGRFPLGGPVATWLDELDVNLGLDLRGGFHLEYEVDLTKVDPAAHEDALNAVQAVIERRVNAFGVGEPIVQIARRGTDRFLIVELPGIKDVEQAKQIIKETPALEFREERTTQEIDAYFEPLNVEVREGAQAALARITNGEDFTEVQKEVDPFAALNLQGGDDQQQEPEVQYAAKGELVGAPAIEAVLFDNNVAQGAVYNEIVESEVAYHIVRKADTRQSIPEAAEGEEVGDPVQEVGYELITFIKQSQRTDPGAIYKATELTGEFLDRAEVTYSDIGVTRPEVSIFFNPQGAEMFSELTKRSVGKTIAIAVDDQIVSAPSVSQALHGGQAQITGNFSLEEATRLAGRLNEGALPVPIELVSQESVDASLGAKALTVSLKAGFIGLLAVMLYMLFYYRILGLVAALAIAFYAGAIIAIMKLSSVLPAGLSITLTLSGIAGLILSIGMAVDANILIFERIREELRRGRRFAHALEEGFKRAWSAILDGNISTIITCLILMIIGTGFVKGFAIILIIGVIVSLFTAVFLVRMVLRMFGPRLFEKYPELIGGTSTEKRTKIFEIIGKRGVTYVLSGILMLMSVGAVALFGLKPGIDFTGGTLIKVQASTGTTITKDALCKNLPENICAQSFTVQKSEDDTYNIRYVASTEEHNQQVRDALASIDPEVKELSAAFVGSKISDQLRGNALTAILLVVAMILIYIAYAFRKISFPVSSWSYGFTAVVALIHDIMIVLGLFAIFGRFAGVEVGIPFIAALLTILGYSVNDTIVVYDRVRENILRTKNTDQFEAILNQSISETLARSFNTSLTVVVVLVAMIMWGSSSLVWFSVALLIGVVAGTYSSIFVATALVATIYQYKKAKGLIK